MYEEFFIKNFTEKEPGMIEVTEFMEFFVKESNMEEISAKSINEFYTGISPFTAENLLKRAELLEVPITEREAKKIIKMVNYKQKASGN